MPKTTIQLQIKNCSECPFFGETRVYTEDRFEMIFDWYCKKKRLRTIGQQEDRDYPPVPKWCPLRVKETE